MPSSFHAGSEVSICWLLQRALQVACDSASPGEGMLPHFVVFMSSRCPCGFWDALHRSTYSIGVAPFRALAAQAQHYLQKGSGQTYCCMQMSQASSSACAFACAPWALDSTPFMTSSEAFEGMPACALT